MVEVPFSDLYSQYLAIQHELDDAIKTVIRRSAFVRGPFVEAFEQAFAEVQDAAYCVSCGNGTDALYIAMKALGVGPGDEVITTAHSWIATSETITQAEAKVVFCDTDGASFTLDPRRVEELVTPRTVGIIPVHLFGQPADMDAICAIADRHGLWVLEDCAQAHLATYRGRKVGTFGIAGTFSFYPGKNLGAMGDAGAIVTNDASLALRMAMFARHGGLKKGEHDIEGINSRMDGIQAAVLNVKLKYLRGWTDRRQAIARMYLEGLRGVPHLNLPVTLPGREHVYHLFVVSHPERDRLAAFLRARGIQTNIHYPRALPFLKAYRYLGHRQEDFPDAWRNQSRILSLPLYPELSDEQVRWVIESIRDFR